MGFDENPVAGGLPIRRAMVSIRSGRPPVTPLPDWALDEWVASSTTGQPISSFLKDATEVDYQIPIAEGGAAAR